MILIKSKLFWKVSRVLMNFKSFDTCLQSKNGEADSVCFAVFYYKLVTKSLSMLRNGHFRGLVSRGGFFWSWNRQQKWQFDYKITLKGAKWAFSMASIWRVLFQGTEFCQKNFLNTPYFGAFFLLIVQAVFLNTEIWICDFSVNFWKYGYIWGVFVGYQLER